MGRVNFADIDHYSGGGNFGSYFTLKDHGDTARVRFMIDGEDGLNDITFAVHKIEVDGKTKWVNCLRAYNEPVENCPFCEGLGKAVPRFFIPLYNEDAGEIQIWNRGKKFAAKLSFLMSRYGTGKKGPLISHIFEIIRNGKANDMQTDYEVVEDDADNTTFEDLPELPEILGTTYVLDKSAEDMDFYIENDYFPPDDEEEEQVTRRGSKEDEEDDEEEVPFEEEKPRERDRSTRRTQTDNNRRTPSTVNRRRQF